MIELQGGSCLLAVGQADNLCRVFAGAWQAEALTLVFQRFDEPDLDPANATADGSIVASVLFGATRTGDRVELDVQNGTAITLPWGNVEATASYESDPQPGATYPTQRVTATVYAGARPGGVRPTRKRRLGILNNGDRVRATVPKYAADVRLYCYPNIYGAITLTPNRAPAGRQLASWTPTSPTAEPLPSGVRAIEVNVTRGAGTVVSLEFGLCL